MKVGDLRKFRNGRNSITRDIVYVLGLILEIHEDPDPISDVCKVLLCDGSIKWLLTHGSSGVSDEGR